MTDSHRSTTRVLAAAVGVVVAMAMFAASCSKTETSSGGPTGSQGIGSADTSPDVVKVAEGQPRSGGTLTMSLEAETDGWLPSQNRWAASGTQVALAVFDPLIAFDKEFNWKPYLAESLTPSSDYTQWTIKLRPDIKFHNGQDLNADALVKSINAFKASTLTGAAAKPIQKVDKVDNLSVKLTMEQPWAAFPFGLSGQAGVVPAPSMLDNPDEAVGHPVGTGPFVFKSWQRDNKFVATKNKDYWRKGLPYFDEVQFIPIPEATSRINSLNSGNTDIMTTSSEESSQQLLDSARDGKLQVVRSRGNNDTTMVLINTTAAPLDDVRLRKAMAYAIDRVQLSQINNADPSLIADSVFQPDSKWYQRQENYPNHDIAKAKQLVDEYTKEKGPVPKFVFGAVTDPAVIRSAQAISADLEKAGIPTDIQTFNQADFILNAVSGKYVAQVWRQFGAVDPDSNYVWWISENTSGPLALNMARNKDPEIDAALREGRASPDFAVRKKAYDKVQARQTDDLPYLWLSHLRWTVGANNNLRGLIDQPLPDGSISAGLVGGVIPITGMWRVA